MNNIPLQYFKNRQYFNKENDVINKNNPISSYTTLNAGYYRSDIITLFKYTGPFLITRVKKIDGKNNSEKETKQ